MTTAPALPEGFITWEDLKQQVDAARTPEQRRAYNDADADADAQIALAELVYTMRTQAGITQTELARRMGTTQPFVSDLERGGRAPTVATLNRVARATDHRLKLVIEPTGCPTDVSTVADGLP